MIKRWLRNLPIQRKLTVITLCAASVAIAAALASYLVFQAKLTRDNAVADLSALAKVVAANVAGPLAFDDRQAGQTVLQGLSVRDDLIAVRLLDAGGKDFALSRFRNGAQLPRPGAPRSDTQTWIVVDGFSLLVSQPVIHGQEYLGTLELDAEITGRIWQMLRYASVATVGILILSLALAYALLSRLQSAVSKPLLHLADTARAVASRKDYTLRVTGDSADEVGQLTRAFNHMLDQVRERDLALSAAKQQLAAQVLVLQHENAERQRVEVALQAAKDAAEAANRAKSSFLATMSHEIRTPMNGVLATANLLLDSRLSDEQRELAGLIRVSGDALLTILNDILDFSKLEAGRVQLEHTDFDLRDLVDDAVELHAVAAAGKGLDVVAEFTPGTPTYVRGDPYRLRQVLMNLVGNAVKFTRTGEVVVSVSQIKAEQPTFRVEVRDTGIGMSAAARSALFQPFTQADSTTTRKFGGTGLGLAISKSLVELMGGKIDLESEPGIGSRFWFDLPLQPQPTEQKLVADPAILNGRKILIVEENDTNRSRLRAQLASWAVEAIEANSAQSALELVRAHHAELAVALVCLPTTNGVATRFAEQLRAEPSWKARPVILVTTQKERVDARSLEIGVISACLFRPVRMRQLASTLDRLLRAGGTASTSDPETSAAVSTECIKVLLAEDNRVNQRVASLMLRRLGCEVTVAVNGRLALECLDNETFDLLLMDCQMPELDGFETTRRIRHEETVGKWSSRKRQFIVAMTANAMEGDRERCLAVGMDDYLTKPIDTSLIRPVLERAKLVRAE